MLLDPVTKKERYYAYLTEENNSYPNNPETKEERYLHYLCENGGIGGGVTQEQIEEAVNKYLTENPVTPTDISVSGKTLIISRRRTE